MADDSSRRHRDAGADPSSASLQLFVVHCERDGHSGLSYPRVADASLCTSIPQTLEKIQAALDTQNLLEEQNITILKSLEGGTFDIAAVRQTLTENSKSFSANRKFLTSCYLAFPKSLMPTALSALKAQKVFSTPELLESILVYLKPTDLLRAIQVNRNINAIFKASPTLRDVLNLRVRPDGFFSTVFCTDIWGCTCGFADISVRINADRQQQKLDLRFNEIPIAVSFSYRQPLPRVGRLCRDMLVCNPPIHSMSVTLNCCPDLPYHATFDRFESSNDGSIADPDPQDSQQNLALDDLEAATSVGGQDHSQEQTEAADATNVTTCDSGEDDAEINAKVTDTLLIQSSTGITVGDIYDATVRLRKQHLYCAHANLRDHRRDGTVAVAATFSAHITLKKNDPYLVEKDRQDTMIEIDWELAQTPGTANRVMSIYIEAKQRGKSAAGPNQAPKHCDSC